MRAKVPPQEGPGRTEAGRLRAETIALLSRFRTTPADELAKDPEQLRKVDTELFSFIDQRAIG